MNSIRKIFPRKLLFWNRYCAIALLLFLPFSLFSEITTIKVVLRNGDNLSGKVDFDSIGIKTNYGFLKLPIRNIKTIEFGLSRAGLNIGQIESWLDTLNYSGNLEQQENAWNKLLSMPSGVVLVVNDYLSSGKRNAGRSAEHLSIESLFEKLLIVNGVTKDFKTKDVVHYGGSNIMLGDIDLSEVQIETEFGKLNIPRQNVSHLELKVVKPKVSLKVSDFQIILYLLIGLAIMLVLMRIFGIMEKKKCPRCKGAELIRTNREFGDKVFLLFTSWILPFRRYKCVQCGWEGLRWRVEKSRSRGSRSSSSSRK